MGFEHAVAHLYLGYFFRDTPRSIGPPYKIGGVVPTQPVIEDEPIYEPWVNSKDDLEDHILEALQALEDVGHNLAGKKGLNQRHSTENPSLPTSSLFEGLTNLARNLQKAALNSKTRIRLRYGHGRRDFPKDNSACANQQELFGGGILVQPFITRTSLGSTLTRHRVGYCPSETNWTMTRYLVSHQP